MHPNHALNDRDLRAIEEALMAVLLGDDPAITDPPLTDYVMAFSKVRRLMGCPIKGGAEGVRAMMEDAKVIAVEATASAQSEQMASDIQ